MPIQVAVGAAEDDKGHIIYSGNETYEGRIAVSSFRFGDELAATMGNSRNEL